MRPHLVIYSLARCAALATPALNRVWAEQSATTGKSQSDLQARAKISEADARKLALAQVPAGKIQSSEWAEEKGISIWSFDIPTVRTKNITEVQVSAKDGKS